MHRRPVIFINMPMNVLVLTPDAVGSTLLQRLITIYMQLQDFDKPVVNLHELTNGLQTYWHEEFNQLVIGRAANRSYHQTLPEITDILKKTDHYKISRLANYHIKQRNDPLELQVPFYQYLNKNFFIIQTKRNNVFEHAISWCINAFTKQLNVYNAGDKIEIFHKFYKEPIYIDTNTLLLYLNNYTDYLNWSKRFFSIGSIFCYEEHLPNLESYILNLPIFTGRTRLAWKERFGINFNDWNKCHYTGSCIDYIAQVVDPTQLTFLPDTDVNLFTKQGSPELIEQYNQVRDESWADIYDSDDFARLPQTIKSECLNIHRLPAVKHRLLSDSLIKKLPKEAINFLLEHKNQYAVAEQAINQMQKLNILPGSLPIKKQTLEGKRAMIKNWDQCIEVYNSWQASHCDVSLPCTEESLSKQADWERLLWHTYQRSDLISH